MIKKILHTQNENAQDIRRVFQVSYKVEAELLGATNFPPLSRPLEEFSNCPNDFVGYYEDHKLVAVVEMKNEEDSMHIQSLVVDPAYFRRGIARKLIEFVLQLYPVPQYTVETGKENGPARKLYENFGFQLLKTYTADEGIIKVRYQKQL
jgi:ribosomal protein S18 acetylase RimI-like enzyme